MIKFLHKCANGEVPCNTNSILIETMEGIKIKKKSTEYFKNMKLDLKL